MTLKCVNILFKFILKFKRYLYKNKISKLSFIRPNVIKPSKLTLYAEFKILD